MTPLSQPTGTCAFNGVTFSGFDEQTITVNHDYPRLVRVYAEQLGLERIALILCNEGSDESVRNAQSGLSTCGRWPYVSVYLPWSEPLSCEALEGVLAHEVAHLAARDHASRWSTRRGHRLASFLWELCRFSPLHRREYRADRVAQQLVGAEPLRRLCTEGLTGKRACLTHPSPNARLRRIDRRARNAQTNAEAFAGASGTATVTASN